MVDMPSLPEGAVDLGHDTFYTKVFEFEGEAWVGIHEWHKCKTDDWYSAGYVAFRNTSKRNEGHPQWEVQSSEPLTISPSLGCSNCGHHGFIRDGKWVPA